MTKDASPPVNPARPFDLAAARVSRQWILGNAGVMSAAALFLITAIVLGGSVARMLENAKAAEREQAIQQAGGDLETAITDSSVAARVYLLSRNAESLDTRARANRAVTAHLAELKRLATGDLATETKISSIASTVSQRIKLYDTLTQVKNIAAAQASEGERLRLARIGNREIVELRQAASARYRAIQTAITDDMRFAMLLALITGIASPVLGLVGINLLRRERESQKTRELQFELMHVQRLAIMGETSAMLAHEINQPLAAASNYLAVMRRLIDSPDSARAMSDRVEQQIQRAAAILRKLRRFIEKRDAEYSLETPEVLIEDAITLLGTIDANVDFKTEIGTGLPQVMVDRVQLQQVLVNLMRNAIEAMEPGPSHDLKLTVTSSDGKTLDVSLADRGPGLSPAVASRLFQPFTTTKQSGMGVGLSICQSIITQHGGRIWAEANPEGGTIFRFILPAADERAVA